MGVGGARPRQGAQLGHAVGDMLGERQVLARVPSGGVACWSFDAAILESAGERDLEQALTPLTPPLEWQVWVASDLRVDGLWRDVSIVVEYQGGDTHGDQRDRAADHVRHERLRGMRYEVLIVDKHDLRYPEVLRVRLLAARQRRQAEPT
jgi:hypothetical protein